MSNPINCYEGGLKHNFEAIWDRVPSGWVPDPKCIYIGSQESKMFYSRYRGHVCKDCGAVVNNTRL